MFKEENVRRRREKETLKRGRITIKKKRTRKTRVAILVRKWIIQCKVRVLKVRLTTWGHLQLNFQILPHCVCALNTECHNYELTLPFELWIINCSNCSTTASNNRLRDGTEPPPLPSAFLVFWKLKKNKRHDYDFIKQAR